MLNILDCIQYGFENSVSYPDPDLPPPAPPSTCTGGTWKTQQRSAPIRTNYNDPSGTELMRFFSDNTPDRLQDALDLHWLDLRNRARAPVPNSTALAYTGNQSLSNEHFNFKCVIPHHLIYAYLVENTGIVGVLRELIFRFQLDESLTKPSVLTAINIHDLLTNTEQLFFKDTGSNGVNAPITSGIRIDSTATRANAYHRLLGMTIQGTAEGAASVAPYLPKEAYNASFVASFERLLKLFWEAYVNASNAVGGNTTDMVSVDMTLRDLRLLLMSRRSADPAFNTANYGRYSLSRVEVSSVVMMAWLRSLVNPGSVLATYLSCDGNTPGDVLMQMIDRIAPRKQQPKPKVHSRCRELFELADSLFPVLRQVEMGFYEQPNVMRDIVNAHISTYVPLSGIANPRTEQDELLSIINNWQIATGNDIKGERQRTLQRA